jgi:hypothetical protein
MTAAAPAWYTSLLEDLSRLEGYAVARREQAPHDPVAQGIEFAVRELRPRLDALNDPTVLLSPEEYARSLDERPAPQTVRKWCEKQQLPGARRSPSGRWLIPANAVRVGRGAGR